MTVYFVLKRMQFDRTRVSVIIPVSEAGSKSRLLIISEPQAFGLGYPV